MQPQKLITIVSKEAYARLRSDDRLIGAHLIGSRLPDGRTILVVYSQHIHMRFSLAEEDGIIVLPGMHDPAPIGDLHKHLAHVKAEPHHTMREVALKLHEVHGPAFHPDV